MPLFAGHRSQKSPLSGATRWEAQGRALGTGRLLGPALGLLASCRLRPSGARCWCRSGGPRRPASLLRGRTGRGGLRASGAPVPHRGSARSQGGWLGGALGFLDLRGQLMGLVPIRPRDLDAVRSASDQDRGIEVVNCPLAGEPLACGHLRAYGFEDLGSGGLGHFSSCGWGSSPDTTSIVPLARNTRGKARNIFRNSQVKQMHDMESLSVSEEQRNG